MSTSISSLAYAPTIPAVKTSIIAAVLAAAGIAASSCTPVQQADAGIGVTVASAVVQLACAGIDGADPAASKVCAPLSSTASQVAQFVATLLKSLPVPTGAALDTAPTVFSLRGAMVTLPAWQARGVIAAAAKLARSEPGSIGAKK